MSKYWQYCHLDQQAMVTVLISFSAFGNPYFIDLDMLIKEGLLTKNM